MTKPKKKWPNYEVMRRLNRILVMLVKNWELLEKTTYGYQERDEEKRVEFRDQLEKIANNRKIYVDEAGFDNREDYPYG